MMVEDVSDWLVKMIKEKAEDILRVKIEVNPITKIRVFIKITVKQISITGTHRRMYLVKLQLPTSQNWEHKRNDHMFSTPLPFYHHQQHKKQELETQQENNQDTNSNAIDLFQVVPTFLPFDIQIQHQNQPNNSQITQQMSFEPSFFTFCAVQGSNSIEDDPFGQFQCLSPIFPVSSSNYTLPCMIDPLEVECSLSLPKVGPQQELEHKFRHLSLSEQVKERRGPLEAEKQKRLRKIQQNKNGFNQQYQFYDFQMLSEDWDSRLQQFLGLEQVLLCDSRENNVVTVHLDHAFIQSLASQQQITFQAYSIRSFSIEEQYLQVDLILPYLEGLPFKRGKGRQKLYLRKHSHQEEIQNEKRINSNSIKFECYSSQAYQKESIMEIQWKWRQGRKLKPSYESSMKYVKQQMTNSLTQMEQQ